MSVDRAQVLERLAAGQSLRQAVESLRPPGERQALKRSAVVHTFDRDVYDAVLKVGGVPGFPDFDEFVQLAEVERVPRSIGLHRLRDGLRSTYWHAWWDDGPDFTGTLPDELEDLVRRLADHYRNPYRPHELLTQLALIAPAEAKELFEDLFQAADDRFDIAGCQDLLNALCDAHRTAVLDPALVELHDDRTTYLRARSHSSNDFLRTGTFYETSGTLTAYQELLSDEGPRVLELHAPAGSGKTMELRWLLSRVLVPQRSPLRRGRIPVAKSDFDFLDPVNVTRHPWLVLLDAAVQLNQQLPGSPFQEFLEAYGWAAPLLRREVVDRERAAAASRRLRNQRARLARSVPNRFVSTLNGVLGDQPVVLIFDTLEEVHLRPQGDLDALLVLLRSLHDRCPGARLVLSGRYPPSGESDDVPRPTARRVPGPFTTADSEGYLRLRGILDPPVRDAVVTKAGGNPFKLSLLADLVQQQPSLSPDQIQQHDADLIYLVLRVINRVEDPHVRWLLRYGVIPRTLDLDFVRAVAEPHLERAMAGDLELDNPDVDPLPSELRRTGATFPINNPPGPDRRLDVEQIWRRLHTYAGTSSWVTPADRASDSLRFHASVLVPMRAVVRNHPVHDHLQRAASQYFERKAAEHRSRWTAYICEAIYHRFQFEGSRATAYWRELLDAIGLDEPERREALAAEVLGHDYLDPSGNPLRWRGAEPIIDPETAVEARFIRMSALTQIARLRQVPPDDQLWSRVERDLAEIATAHERIGHDVVPWWRLAYVQAALQLKVGALHEAERLLRAAMPRVRGLHDEVRLHVLLGDVELALGRVSASDAYTRAHEVVMRHGLVPGRLITIIHARRIKAHQVAGRFDRAAEVLATALAVDGLDSDHHDELRLLAVDNGLSTGRLTWAKGQVEALSSTSPRHDAVIAAAKVALAGRDPVGALGLVVPKHPHLVDSARPGPLHPGEYELIGLASGSLARFDEALSALESARALWHAEGDLEAVARCHTHSALLQMREVGNFTLAEQHLAEAFELHPPPPGQAWLALTLARAELLTRRNRPEEALELTRDAVERLQGDARSSSLVRTAVEGLATGLPDHRAEFLRLLATNLRRITPSSARVVALAELHRVPTPDDEDSIRQFRRVRRMLRGLRRHLDTGDVALQELTVAEVYRLSGKPEKARRTLAAAARHGGELPSPFFVREWARALDRLGKPIPDHWTIVHQFVEAFGDHHMMGGIFQIERAEAALQHNDAERARQVLIRAREAIDQAEEHETQWQGRLALAEAEIERLAHERSVEEWTARAYATFNLLGSSIRLSPLSEHFIGHAPPSDALTFVGEQVDTAKWLAGNSQLPLPRLVGRSLRRVLRDNPNVTAEELSEALATLLGDDWTEIARELGEVMPGRLAFRSRGQKDTTELMLVVGDRRWNMMPWELAYHPGTADLVGTPTTAGPLYRTTSPEAARRDEVGYVQMALNRLTGSDMPVDGSFGDRTRRAVSAYQRRRGLEPTGKINDDLRRHLQQELLSETPLVVLIQQSPWQQLVSHRGHASTGVDLHRLYRRNGFDVEVVENPTLDRLARRLRTIIDGGRVPSVLHFSGGLREFSGGVAFSFVTSPWEDESYIGPRAAEEIPVSSMDRLLASFPRDGLRPVVVLDVDRPRGPTDMALHLLQRNAFAGELFSLGRCAAVLGTGLVGREGIRLYEELVYSLASGRSLTEVITTLRELAPGERELDRILPFLGAALFTHLPWLRLVPERERRT
ncbi:peptidoglycan-binding protein [Saccharothrix saharensis]|uniref:peptidoglycan-binding protein n=1 Tax=Saccharothrix saharensis TaxID=571190 RepID=UPI00368A807B